MFVELYKGGFVHIPLMGELIRYLELLMHAQQRGSPDW